MRLGLGAIMLAAGLAALAPAAGAGILMEGLLQGEPVRAELGRDQKRVLVTLAGTRRLVDLEHDLVYQLDGKGQGRTSARLGDDGEPILPYSLRQWSNGPPVAGQGSFYNVLQVDGRVCGEVLASPWMSQFVRPIVEAMTILQQVDKRVAPKRREGCGAIPFDIFALNGWPLMAGWKDDTTFLTRTIRFDHPAPEALFQPPSN